VGLPVGEEIPAEIGTAEGGGEVTLIGRKREVSNLSGDSLIAYIVGVPLPALGGVGWCLIGGCPATGAGFGGAINGMLMSGGSSGAALGFV